MERRGAINCYRPYKRAGFHHLSSEPFIYTVNLANGVTPFMLLVNGKEYASDCYKLPHPPSVIVTQAWYRPTKDEWDKMEPSLQNHILNGGLVHNELGKVVTLPEDPVQCDWTYERFQEFALKTYGRRLGPLEMEPC